MQDVTNLAPGVYTYEISGEQPISGVGTALPAFLGLAPKGPRTPTLVANWTQYKSTFGGVRQDMALGKAVYAYLANGGKKCMVVRCGGSEGDAESAASANVVGAKGDAFAVTARRPGPEGNSIKIIISESKQEPSATDDSTDGGDSDSDGDGDPGDAQGASASFDVVITGPSGEQESYTGVTDASLQSTLGRSQLVSVSPPASGLITRPNPGTTQLMGGAGGDASAISVEAFVGDEAEGTGIAGLAVVDEVTMVAAPDLVTAHARGALEAQAVQSIQTKMIDHCEALKDRMAIIDPPLYPEGGASPSRTLSAQDALAWRDGLTSSAFAAAYYPWVTVLDPATRQLVAEPPSGYVAGVWARTDAERGVSVAPTGRVRGAVGLSRQLTDAEQGMLNPRGVNCLRVFRGSGPVIWGARTLSDRSELRYLNVRRLLNFMEESVEDGTRWAVFEPNDSDLWAKLRRSIEAFLLGQWRGGALVGRTPEEAFYVRCDDETNPQDQIDQGIVTVEVGVAPSKPAEFVRILVRQSTDGAAVAE